MTDTEIQESMWIEESPDDHTNTTAWKFEQRKFSTHQYRLKSAVDAERAEVEKEAANMKHDIERMIQTNADMATEIIESDKTIAALAEALNGYAELYATDGDHSESIGESIHGAGCKALSDNAPRIAEAQENQK